MSAAVRESLGVLLDDGRVAAALDDDPWDLIDWNRLLRRAEILAIEGLLAEEADES